MIVNSLHSLFRDLKTIIKSYKIYKTALSLNYIKNDENQKNY